LAQPRDLVVVDVLEQQHAAELALVVARKPAGRREGFGVPVGAEQPVPDRQVGVVEMMRVELVMDRVQLTAANSITMVGSARFMPDDPQSILDLGRVRPPIGSG
jgi:hypothetical protein